MALNSNLYDYPFTNSSSLHHHAYLISPLLALLSQGNTPSQPKPRVLDIGCGNGSLTNLIAEQGYEVFGVEQSDSGVSLARTNFPNCHFIQASIYDLPWADLEQNFDIVISTEVIEHLFYPRELVKAAKKCLKPNGRLILNTPYHGYIKNLVLAVTGKMDKHFMALWDGGHIKIFPLYFKGIATVRRI